MSDRASAGVPPVSVTTLLRIEGLAVLIAAVAAYAAIGGNWWLFALLLLAPDLSMLGLLLANKTGAWTYNLAHTYALPAALAAIGWASGFSWMIPVAIVWVAHIGMDRAVGYGLRYPHDPRRTHLGIMGRKKQKSEALADPR